MLDDDDDFSEETGKAPRAPAGLGPAARRFWKAALRDFEVDAVMLELLRQGVAALDRAERCKAQINKDGELIFDRFGTPRKHPLLEAEVASRSQFRMICRQLLPDDDEERGPGRPPRDYTV